MKKIFAILSVLPLSIFAQTTLDEYNYCVKGYKTTLEQGLDVKKGYEVLPVQELTFESSQFNIYYLCNETDKSVKAAIVVYKTKTTEKHLCVADMSSSNDVINLALKDWADFTRIFYGTNYDMMKGLYNMASMGIKYFNENLVFKNAAKTKTAK